MTGSLPPTDRSRLRRMHDLGSFNAATIHAILDAQPLCTVAYIRDGKPYLTPTNQWREGIGSFGTALLPATPCAREGVRMSA